MLTDPLFYAAAVPAVALTGLSKGGFGGAFGFAAVPIMALVISPVQAAGLMLPLLVVADLIAVWNYRRLVDWSLIRHFLPAGVFGIALGWATASLVPDDVVRLLVGVIAFVFVARIMLARSPVDRDGKATEAPPGRRRSFFGATLWGTLTGYTSFVAHAGGPPYQTYVMPMRLPPVLYVGTTAIYFAALNCIKLIPYAALGQINSDNLVEAVILAPVAIIATVAGVRLVRYLHERLFYRVLAVSMALVGLKLVFDGVRSLLGW